MTQPITLTAGQTFGRWKILKFADKHPTNGEYHYLVECSCKDKTRRELPGSVLRKGKSLSCGCYSKECNSRRLHDLTDQKFGLLKVIRRIPGLPVKWLCVCEGCNRNREVYASNLLSGKSRGCISCTQTRHNHAKRENRDPYYNLWARINCPGRGEVCPEWRGPSSFPTFRAEVLETIGPKPAKGKVQFIRINANESWYANNISWYPATKRERRKKYRRKY